jgi:signal transduction histidine kinase
MTGSAAPPPRRHARPGPMGSLRWQLVWRLVTLQAGLLTLFVLLIVAALWREGFTFDTATGGVRIITSSEDEIPLSTIVRSLLLTFGTVILPSLVPMILATLVATPIVVRAALGGLGDVVHEAERIDIGQRGARLPIENVPAEVGPLVSAVNDALRRLDDGYERHARFLADAAHELRTPIAILHTRLESLPDDADRARLLEDVSRLATLAEQLLDLQRLDQRVSLARIDLTAIGRRVAADLAPMAIAAGYEMAFDTDTKGADEVPVMVMGDRLSLERAVINLVQNAIEHGGRRGTITIHVDRSGAIDVSDQGAGIPPEQRERIFEPFYRLHPHGRGAGLGLNLVQEVVRRHNGRVSVTDGVPTGARFRIEIPLAT